MSDAPKIIMIMVDGFGIPADGWEGSVYAECCSDDFMDLLYNYSISLDAVLGVSGIPQSATGQTALFTGINASEVMNKHCSGFPGPTLKKIIEKQNIFKALQERNKSVVFANAYIRSSLEKIATSRFCSVTSCMVVNTINKVFDRESLILNKSVHHDITREAIVAKYNIPAVSPEAGAQHLLGVSKNVDFTLFEYFRTDIAGHRQDKNILEKVLNILSRFIVTIKNSLSDNTSLLITSDHGNCEDLSTPGHTTNLVPLIYYPKKTVLPKAKSIVDVYNLIVEVLD